MKLKLVIAFGVLLIAATVVALLSLLRSVAYDTSYLSALDEIVFAFLTRIWDLLSQPIVFAAIALFLFLRYSSINLRGILPFIDELSASLGPLSMTGRFDPNRLIADQEPREEATQLVPPSFPNQEVVENVIARINLSVAKVLIDVANRDMENDELSRAVISNVPQALPDNSASRRLALGFAAGIIRSLNGVLFQFTRDRSASPATSKLAIDRPTLDALYERVKKSELESAPSRGST